MSEHCVINGQRCSKCCTVLTIRESPSFREWRSYIRRNGYNELNDDKYKFVTDNKIYHLVRKISKRRAKKINPHLVSVIGNSQAYFTCKNYTGEGCSDYKNRPQICSGYPYYGKSREEFLAVDENKDEGLYNNDCTFYIGDSL